jgi:hypothetical protein
MDMLGVPKYTINTPELFEFSGAANGWLPLAVREGRALQLLHLHGSRVGLGHLNLLRSTTCCGSRPRVLGSDRDVMQLE